MKTSVVVFLSLLGMSAFSFGEEPAVHRPFEPTWESLQHHQVPEWYRDGKFGIFVHWGPQALAGAAGSFDGTQSPWKELANKFKGEKFDPAHCADLFHKAGAKYVVQVVEHHDAYALYDSSHTEWSSVKMLPKRDFAAELSGAVRKEGLVYGASSHTEENWWFYSDPPHKLKPITNPGEQPPKEWLDNWYARLVEIVDKYDPQIFWFDWSIQQPAYEPYLRKFAAYYYNHAAEKGHGALINYKYDAFPPGAGVLDISVNTGGMACDGIRPVAWQFDTWSSNGLWFWRPTMHVRPTAALIQEMADVVSKNGNYLLNVTPDPDGVITPAQEQMLAGIGQWMTTNGAAIYSTRPWKTFGEGPTAGLGASFKANVPKTPYTSQDIRFTARDGARYAIVLAWPDDGRVTIHSITDEPRKVILLGSEKPVNARHEADGLAVDLSNQTPTTFPFVLEIEAK